MRRWIHAVRAFAEMPTLHAEIARLTARRDRLAQDIEAMDEVRREISRLLAEQRGEMDPGTPDRL